MKLRLWENSDSVAVANLEKECFSDPWSLQMIEQTASRQDFLGLVVEDGGEIVGYIGCLFAFEQADILLVAVNKAHRGKGYGKQLMESALQLLKINQIESVFLEVRVSNKVARSCYLSCGFKEIAVRKGYYSNGEDAVIMEKSL